MKAQFPGYCELCATRICPQEEVESLCGTYVHAGCKRTEVVKRALSAGPVIEIPAEHRPDKPLVAGIKSRNRRNFRRMNGGGRR